MAGTLLMEISKDERERAHYRSRRMFETDKFHNESVIKERAEKLGEQRGEIRGEIRGSNKRAYEIARNMKSDGDPIDKIARNTGLTIAEVEKA